MGHRESDGLAGTGMLQRYRQADTIGLLALEHSNLEKYICLGINSNIFGLIRNFLPSQSNFGLIKIYTTIAMVPRWGPRVHYMRKRGVLRQHCPLLWNLYEMMLNKALRGLDRVDFGKNSGAQRWREMFDRS